MIAMDTFLLSFMMSLDATISCICRTQPVPGMASDAKPKLLIANRGEIARRVARSCRALGVEPVVVYTQADALSMHVLEATCKVCLGASTREYTNAAKLVEIAKEQG